MLLNDHDLHVSKGPCAREFTPRGCVQDETSLMCEPRGKRPQTRCGGERKFDHDVKPAEQRRIDFRGDVRCRCDDSSGSDKVELLHQRDDDTIKLPNV